MSHAMAARFREGGFSVVSMRARVAQGKRADADAMRMQMAG